MTTDPLHPTAAALVAAVRADLSDSLPRLVYADWLDEQIDRAARILATYIRVETEVAGVPQGEERGANLMGQLVELSEKSTSPLGGWEYTADLNRIRQKMDALRAADPTMVHFGVAFQGRYGHGYRIQPAISEPALLQFELELARHPRTLPRGELFPSEAPLGWLLPPDYRAFLLHIGNGLMGPYYGLTPLDVKRDMTALRRQFPISRAAESHAEVAYRNGDTTAAVHFDDGHEEDGNLHLCELGCGGVCLLAVNGDTFGNVWVSWDTGVSIALRADGVPHTFLTWYENWLDTSLKPVNLERWRSLAERRSSHT